MRKTKDQREQYFLEVSEAVNKDLINDVKFILDRHKLGNNTNLSTEIATVLQSQYKVFWNDSFIPLSDRQLIDLNFYKKYPRNNS